MFDPQQPPPPPRAYEPRAGFVNDEADATYAPPAVVGGMFIQMTDAILYMVVFFLAAQWQTELDRSQRYLALLGALVFAVIIFQAMLERLRAVAGKGSHRRYSLGVVLAKLILLVIAFLTGLLARTLTNAFISGPTHGHFDFYALAIPFTVIVLFVVLLHHFSVWSAHRADIDAALRTAS